MSEEIHEYGKGTRVKCKKCFRPIPVEGKTTVTVRDGQRYLTLTCPVQRCQQVSTYEENELEIR
jgi:RNase P subunit RPR2